METIFIHEKDFTKARDKIRKNKGKKIVFSSDDDELARKILEKEKIDVLLLNQRERKDRQKQRESGFDHVMAKLAKKKDVSIGINLDEILNFHGKKKAEILARIQQNIKLCNKNKLKMIFLKTQERNQYDLKALGLVLGMPTWMLGEI
ncbi:hypothetical protein HYT25_00185 [Candidatus Pacearchaeota archaeon]|nr:hypothetical protein [Candidatus Pacearchaeota archaeon]